MPERPRLLLAGAGHAHIGLLRRLILEGRPEVELTVLNLEERHYYSGMVPGYLAGQYGAREISFDVAALTRLAGGRFRAGRAVAVDPRSRRVVTEDGSSLAYDLVSFNLGSRAAGYDVEGVAPHALSVKPFSRVRRLAERLEALARADEGASVPVAVVGGGAAGVEIACAAHAVLARAGRRPEVTVYEAGERILEGYSERFLARARGVLAEKGIAIRTGTAVVSVSPEAVTLAGGDRHPAGLTVWLTGAAAPRLFAESGLPTDGAGFLLVDTSLRALGVEAVFGAGDCVTLAPYPDTPKAGVYAVREAPVLWQSLVAAVEGGEPPAYEPQESFLSLLNTAEGKALLRWKRLVSHSRWAFRLKDAIDRRFMRRHGAEHLAGAARGPGRRSLGGA